MRIETAHSAPPIHKPRPKPKPKRARTGSESEGGASGGDSSSDDEDGDKGKDLLHKLSKGGGGLYKAKGHGAADDYGRALFYDIEINGDGGEENSTILRSQNFATGCKSTKLGTQGALISTPVKYCITSRDPNAYYRPFYWRILLCWACTVLVPALYLNCSIMYDVRIVRVMWGHCVVSFARCTTPHFAVLRRARGGTGKS